MFSRMQLCATPGQVAAHFKVRVSDHNLFCPADMISAFDHGFHPIIRTSEPDFLTEEYHWGLVPPDWNKPPDAIWNHTISAKLEYLNKRYSWQKIAMNRCIIPATAYYEYHWNDQKGKSKTRFAITSTESRIFALAGLYAECIQDEQVLRTFAVCTTVGNETMKFVHNKDAARNYSRMPVMLNRGDEKEWLNPEIDYLEFGYPNYNPKLTAEPQSGGVQGSLF